MKDMISKITGCARMATIGIVFVFAILSFSPRQAAAAPGAVGIEISL